MPIGVWQWLLHPTAGGWAGQPCGNPGQGTLAFGRAPDGLCSSSRLPFQPYITQMSPYPPSPTFPPQDVSQTAATLGVVPMSTAGNWPGTPSHHRQQEYHLARYETSTPLLKWAEEQVLRKSQGDGSFEDAINAFIFALRDTPLKDGRATIMVPSDLVRSVCDMVSWIKISQASVVYVHGVELGSGLATSRPLPEAVTWEIKNQAITSVGPSERVALSALDELRLKKIGAERLSVWACLWQMILIYRKLMAAYAKMPSGQACLAGAVITIEEIHRLLLVKYATYFGSSSPIYHKSGSKTTLELIAGDTRLRTAWEDILRRRMQFCKS